MFRLTTLAAIEFWQLNANPNTLVTAKIGSFGWRNTLGSTEVWQNIDGAATWRQVGGSSSGQWLLPSNQNPALQIGSAGDLDMLGWDTTVGAEVVYVGATLGLRLNDSRPLRFGTDGTDVIMNPNGTDVEVTGTGAFRYLDNFNVQFGTAVNDRFVERYDSAGGRYSLTGANVTAGGAAAASRSVFFGTGGRFKNDNNAGLPASGSYLFQTGPSDVTFAGAATGGPSGGFDFFTGAAGSSGAGATSGNSGGFNFQTGNSDDAISGGFSFSSGTGPGGRGIFDINCPTIDTQTQATTWAILNANANALRIGTTAVPNMMNFSTSGGIQTIQFLEGALTNLSIAVVDTGDGAIAAGFMLRNPFPAGVGPTDLVLPARVGGWRVVDAYIVNNSGGAGAGTLQVQTGAGVAISDAMVPGLANVITRALSVDLAAGTLASGGTLRLAGAAGTTAGIAYVRFEPL